PSFFGTPKWHFASAAAKGPPYPADAVTETTQTLADGNRIHRTSKAALYRDSEGRTRREQTLGELGPLVSSGEPIQTIVINDPVAQTSYMLNSSDKIAHKMPGRGMMATRVGEFRTKLKADIERDVLTMAPPAGQHFEMHVNRIGGEARPDAKNFKKESLGTQMIEGVAAEGTRTTTTIPAGQIGNERPIEIVTETWYSNQL